MFHCCLEVINRRGLDPSNLVFDPPPQEKDSEVAIRGMPRDSWQSQNDSYSFDFYSFDSYSFEQWVVAPSCCQTLTWPVTDELLPARPDCEQIIKGIDDINTDLPASPIIHLPTSPFPSMSQTNSCHHRAIPYLKHASLSSGYSGTQEMSYFLLWAWVKGIPSLITLKKWRKAFLPANGDNSKHFLTSV